MNVFLGVSLGSRKFSRRFFKALPAFVQGRGGHDLYVVVFDHGEVLNYTTLNDYDKDRAGAVAARRGDEIRRMIARTLAQNARGIAWSVSLSSEDRTVLDATASAEQLLQRVVSQSTLRQRLAEQAVSSLARLSRIKSPVEQHRRAETASNYLIVEAAWSWAFFSHYSMDLEVYPGPVQWFKDRVLHGRIHGAESLALREPPTFLNCESLCGDDSTSYRLSKQEQSDDYGLHRRMLHVAGNIEH